MTEKQRAQTAARQQRFRERQVQSRRVEQDARGLPPLPSIGSMPGHSRWNAALLSAQMLIQQVHVEMATYFDARSAVWQEGEGGEAFVERQAAVEAVLGQLEELRF